MRPRSPTMTGASSGRSTPCSTARSLANGSPRWGEVLRFDTSLDRVVVELATIIVAARWRSDFEWAVHSRMAAQAGVAATVIDALGRGDEPPLEGAVERAVHRLVVELLDDGQVSDAAYRRGERRARIGRRGRAGRARRLLLPDLVRAQHVSMFSARRPDASLGRRLTAWLAGQDSNLQPPDPKSGVLPVELPAMGVCTRSYQVCRTPETRKTQMGHLDDAANPVTSGTTFHERSAGLRHRAGRRRGHADAVRAPQAAPPGVRPADDHARPHALTDLDVARTGRGHRPRRRAGHQEGAGPEPRRPATSSSSSSAVQRGTGDAVMRGPHRLPRRRRRRHLHRRGAARRHPAAAARHRGRAGRPSTRRRQRRHRAVGPRRRPDRLRPGAARAATAGSPASSSSATPRPRSGPSTRSTRASTASGATCSGPALRRLSPDNAQGEYYLTDVIAVLSSAGYPVGAMVLADRPGETQGVNDRAQLAVAETELRARTNRRWLLAGVTMLDPEQTYIDVTVELGRDVTLFPGTILQGRTIVGAGCEIGPDTRLVDCVGRRRRRRRAQRRPRGRDRRGRPRRTVRGRSSPAPVVPAWATGRLLHWPSGVGVGRRDVMERVTTKRLALYTGRMPPGAGRGDRRPPRRRAGRPQLVNFANGEIRARYADSIRGTDVFIIQSHYGSDDRSINDSIMEQLIMIDAAHRASAKRITAVLPLLRLRPPGPQGRGPRAHHRPPGGQHVPRRRGQADGLASTSTPARSRASSTARSTTSRPCRCSRTTSAEHSHRPGDRVAGRRPGQGGRAHAQHLDADVAFINKRRPKGMRQRGRGPGRHRRRRGPPVRHRSTT